MVVHMLVMDLWFRSMVDLFAVSWLYASFLIVFRKYGASFVCIDRTRNTRRLLRQAPSLWCCARFSNPRNELFLFLLVCLLISSQLIRSLFATKVERADN